MLSLVSSGTGQQTSNSQSEITYPSKISFNSLPQMTANLTEERNAGKGPVQNLLAAGSPILVGSSGPNGVVWNKCTGNFMIVNSNSTECKNGNDYGGFLTSFFCLPPVLSTTPPPGVVNWDSSVSLGKLYYGPTMYWNGTLPDKYLRLTAEYLYISADLTSVKLTPFVPKTTDEGTIDLLPVISSSNPTAPGLPVCVYGAASGYRCGKLIAMNLNLVVPNPVLPKWGDLMLNNLNKVDLGTNGLLSEDVGAPVYCETQIGDRTLAQALGHISVIDNNDPQHQSFYYSSLEQALDGIISDQSCTYSLLTYNEKNAEEYEELLNQVEIPPKK